MIITLARQCGCGGDEIGHTLEQAYHIPFYDRRVLCEIAKGKGMYERYPDFYGEIPLDTLLFTISQAEDDTIFHEIPKKNLQELVDEQDCIILGRCGNYAFSDCRDVLSVFLTGDEDMRVRKIAEKHGISEKKAKNLVARTDERRRAYHKYYTGQEWGQAQYYDLCLNVSKLGIDGVLAMIETYKNRRRA